MSKAMSHSIKQRKFVHRRVKNAEYRLFQNRTTKLWSVTEYYKGERTVLADKDLTEDEALALATRLSERDEF